MRNSPYEAVMERSPIIFKLHYFCHFEVLFGHHMMCSKSLKRRGIHTLHSSLHPGFSPSCPDMKHQNAAHVFWHKGSQKKSNVKYTST